MNKVLVIINPASGQDFPILAHLNRAFSQTNTDWEVIVTRPKVDLNVQLSEYDLKEFQALVLYGGDGTISETIEATLHTPLPILILPGGTGNSLARELGIPLMPQAALKLWEDQELTPLSIDIGLANKHMFLKWLIIGDFSQAAVEATREEKNMLGNVAYLQKFLSKVNVHTNISGKAWIDGKEKAFVSPLITISNTKKLGVGNIVINDKADIASNSLAVNIFDELSVETFLDASLEVLLKQDLTNASISLAAQQIKIQFDKPTSISIDEELIETKTLEVSLAAHKLKVLVPKSSPILL